MGARFNVYFEINSCDYDVLLLSQTWKGSKTGMATGRNRTYLSGGFVHQGVGVVISNTFHSNYMTFLLILTPAQKFIEVQLRHVEIESLAIYLFPYVSG